MYYVASSKFLLYILKAYILVLVLILVPNICLLIKKGTHTFSDSSFHDGKFN